MMNKKRICIFLALILVFAAGIILVRLASAPEEDSQKEMVLIREDREGEEGEDAASTLPTSGENREQRYYLVVEDGYLSVYYGADRTFYAYTDIRYDMLDEATRHRFNRVSPLRTSAHCMTFLRIILHKAPTGRFILALAKSLCYNVSGEKNAYRG